MLIPVILSGGSGSRLWPESRAQYPKQFLPLTGNESMIQNTVGRLAGISDCSALMVICNEDHRFIVAEQLRAAGQDYSSIILEPCARNTAPALAIAALRALSNHSDEDPLLLVLAADHDIRDVEAFQQAVSQAIPAANDGQLVTFGIVPTKPETGYGYIKAVQDRDIHGGCIYSVEAFVEKPDEATAVEYIDSGAYYWNSGMFLLKASRYLEELETFRPDILSSCRQAMSDATIDLDFVRPEKTAFESCPSDSIDYAVMENTADAVVIPLDAGWSDVGSWSSLWEITEKDGQGNVVNGDVMLEDCHNNYIRSSRKLIAAVGVDDLVMVDTDDAVLVARKDRSQDVKRIVERLLQSQRSEACAHRKVYRPWGHYDGIDAGDRFQVKRITVKPGATLSLQKHHHRAEHWIVVRGTALVTNGEQEILLTENQSTYIPIGTIHRLENPGKVDLELIEVQSGAYLGEDDIVRLEDNYGRTR
ncbi:mannose-1-phosphate guanylyltransferase/mannose-6-phosphate isomerase [Kistimonas asteriae]|uniref:mannose-1-phosphate guanylyltransferase/mannose-6-phosphate isomerase n=1 Tax=Kistimonas asteriae TaxID=517724 RepID=UPI001FE90F02|nr:mannose-1-phosphate guanylyltransferase/mannose-6-phosphate isomerase [Kistimonas asteriae]